MIIIEFPKYQKANERLVQKSNELKNKTRFYFRNDVQNTAQRVQQGQASIENLYDRLNKLNQSNLLHSYDQGYPDIFHDGLDNVTVEEAYGSYLKYPEQYQNLDDFKTSQENNQPPSNIMDDDIGDQYESTLRQSHHLRSRVKHVKKILKAFDSKYVSHDQAFQSSISICFLCEPSCFYHLTKEGFRAELASRLLGTIDYQININIDLPLNQRQKKRVKVQILDGSDKSVSNLPPADIDIFYD